jgi:hypothetical protein
LAWFALGLALALWLRTSSPARYAEIGRFVNHAMVPEDPEGETQPVMVP